MTRYSHDYGAFDVAVLCAPWMVAEMKRRAELVAAAAVASAPVDEDGPHPGRYKGAFSVESGVRTGKTTRAYGRVTNDAPEARFVEFGTRNNPRHRTLGKALDAAGG
jgi:hypothetical protein